MKCYVMLACLLVVLSQGCIPTNQFGLQALVFARGADSQKLDPADVDEGQSIKVLNNICEGLVRFKTSTAEM